MSYPHDCVSVFVFAQYMHLKTHERPDQSPIVTCKTNRIPHDRIVIYLVLQVYIRQFNDCE